MHILIVCVMILHGKKQVFEQHRHEAAASGGASKKASQKETAGALVEFVHAFETVQKLGEAAETAELKAQFAAVEKAMRREGVCLVLRLLQLLVRALETVQRRTTCRRWKWRRWARARRRD